MAYKITGGFIVEDTETGEFKMAKREAAFTTTVPESLQEEEEWDSFIGSMVALLGQTVGFGPNQWGDFLKRIERRGI